MNNIRVGVVGVGSLGFHHARLLAGFRGARLVGVHDVDQERCRTVAHEFHCEAYTALAALLADVDAVTIAVPTTHHFTVARSALQSGCHVLIEKPLTSTLEEADTLIELAQSSQEIVQVGHIERFNGAVRACEPYLDRPLFVESHRLAPFAQRGTDVAVVLDLMIHDIDLILSLVRGRVVDVRAVGVSVLSPSVDIANARLEFEGGAVANISASRVSLQRQRKMRFFQPSGYLSLDLGNGTGEFHRRMKTEVASPNLEDIVERIEFRGDDQEPLELELQAFLEAIRGNAPVAVTVEEGRQALALALDIVEHIEEHRQHVFDSTSAPT